MSVLAGRQRQALLAVALAAVVIAAAIGLAQPWKTEVLPMALEPDLPALAADGQISEAELAHDTSTAATWPVSPTLAAEVRGRVVALVGGRLGGDRPPARVLPRRDRRRVGCRCAGGLDGTGGEPDRRGVAGRLRPKIHHRARARRTL